MKRRRHNKGKKPSWQLLPMQSIVDFVIAWERLKSGREISKSQPDAQERLAQDPDLAFSYDDDLTESVLNIVKNGAMAHVKRWLGDEDSVVAALPDSTNKGLTVALEMIMVWETSLCLLDLGNEEDHFRWLTEISREEKNLVMRLRKRVTPTKPPRHH